MLKGLIDEYKEEMFGCTRNLNAHHTQLAGLVPCDQIPANEIRLRFQQDPYISFVVKAVSAITASFR